MFIHVTGIDECLSAETNECGENTVCLDETPGYSCTCITGYEQTTSNLTCVGKACTLL